MTGNSAPELFSASVLHYGDGWSKDSVIVYRPKSKRYPCGRPDDIRIRVGDRVISLRGDRAVRLADALVDAYEEPA